MSNVSTLMLALIIFATIVGCAPPANPRPPSDAAVTSRSTDVPESPPSKKAVPSDDIGVGVPQPASSKQLKGQTLDELLLFFPSKYPEGDWKPKGLNFEDVWFRADDGTCLHGWYCPCDNPRAIVLYAHGNAGNLSHSKSLIQYFHDDLRVTVLIFDYRGYGRSEGVPTAEGILKDARAARTLLAPRQYQGRPSRLDGSLARRCRGRATRGGNTTARPHP